MDDWLKMHVWSQNWMQRDSVMDFLPQSWIDYLQLSTFSSKKLEQIMAAVENRRKQTIVYPASEDVMRWAFSCQPENVQVVILGQDPYHGGQATGLAFSVHENFPVPPSLHNIFQELKRSVPDFKIPPSGCLDKWAEQGVLLLNCILTVDKGRPGSHHKLGWGWFTDYVISTISEKNDKCVFMLWGNKAIEKEVLINGSKHLVLKAQHPSPLASLGGYSSKQSPFLGCDHFSIANTYLTRHNRPLISWNL
ncbi:uracil-DNA glycosylase [Wood mouse herpesvirus]|uniref:Uracil-DNA glycosylase n=1 Tax=Wood mouse herpesvirus TaxID=432370 RepID=D0PPD4_9GAMA|nr:uracil-DNA glycosylase [Wood mouse herpesvirus]ABO48425.1 uracil-DNA glycosylase [Wood mouse herpesvirus]ACY41117.1 uracil-DNA glycosylase [Wood mouse herpesvirus]